MRNFLFYRFDASAYRKKLLQDKALPPSTFMCLIILIFGLFALYLSFNGVKKICTNHAWLMTDGRVVSSEIIQGTARIGYIYWPQIVYSYAVDGKTYFSDNTGRIYEIVGFYPREEAEAFIKQFTDQPILRVYYSPESPSNSVLLPNADWSVSLFIAWIGFGSLFSVFFAIMHLYLKLQKFRNRVFATNSLQPIPK